MTAIAHVAPIAGPELAPIRSRLAAWIARVGTILRQLGPYAAIEILLPGGTLMALLLWLYRRSAHVRARQREAESVAYAQLCMECGVANGHFDLPIFVAQRELGTTTFRSSNDAMAHPKGTAGRHQEREHAQRSVFAS